MTKNKDRVRFIDLFAGIGGFHIAFSNLGAECVWVSEWDKYARKTYENYFKPKHPKLFENSNNFVGDITKVDPKEIPDFDILTGGFPCQPFSQAGHKRGFDETRGTLFFNIAAILEAKKPKAFFIENVRGLLNHDGGKTLSTMRRIINELGYSFYYKVIKASDFGLPTYRPRLYMVGFRNKDIPFTFPEPIPLKLLIGDVLGGKTNREIGFTLRVGGKSSGIGDRRNWDTYLVDDKPRKITVKEATKLMGFPNDFTFPVSDTQAMKQLGNSVAVPAIQATAAKVLEALQKYEQ